MKYLISIQYDGSKFYGFQRLNDKNTVQGTIEKALSIIAKEKIVIKGAGRTDHGVHALDQKASFEFKVNIDTSHLKQALNSLIKPYIYITDIKIVNSDFHARFNVSKKAYIYKINLGEYNPLLVDYTYQPNYPIDLKKMIQCSKLFLGVHNFKNFVSGERANYECIIYDINIIQKKDILEIKFIGQSFYRYMVRNLVGAMLEVSRNNVEIKDIKDALDNPEKPHTFTTAQPQGLYLAKIDYEEL